MKMCLKTQIADGRCKIIYRDEEFNSFVYILLYLKTHYSIYFWLFNTH